MTPLENVQQPEPVSDRDDALEVVGVFPTVQGEGPLAGVPAVFVRTAGCSIRCPGCDTQYTTGRRFVSHADLIAEIEAAFAAVGAKAAGRHRLVVVTGGEPFRQPKALSNATLLMLMRQWTVQVETNGLHYTDDFPYYSPYVWVVVSPKGAVNPKLRNGKVAAYKYVLDHRHVDPQDGLPTAVLGRGRPDRPPPRFERGADFDPDDVYLQPADTGDPAVNAENLKAVLKSCQTFGYRVSAQLHKIWGLP